MAHDDDSQALDRAYQPSPGWVSQSAIPCRTPGFRRTASG